MIAAYGPYYRETVAQQGYEDATIEIREHWEAGDRAAAVAAVPEALLYDLVAAGTPEAVREEVARFGGIDGVDAIWVGIVGGQNPAAAREKLAAVAAE